MIGLFLEDDGLHNFPEEPVEVHRVTLRSGTQLPDVRPPFSSDMPASSSNPASTDLKRRQLKKILAHLKKIPSLLSVYDALCLSPELRKALITALSFPEDSHAEVAQIEAELAQSCSIQFTETDDDLLLGSRFHNRPLLVIG